MGKSLVIVESPTKAKTINKFLGSDYVVKASNGHIKDLPPKKLGVDVENGFEPEYEIIRGRKKAVNDLKKLAKDADNIYLAPDPDREGEAICWHLANELGKSAEDKVYRVLFNEITKNAIQEAFKHASEIDENKFNAQQARRILDRLVGYKISPLLWRPVRKGLSAGRVQSVAVRMICEREEEIEAFKPEEYWSITGKFMTEQKEAVIAKLNKIKSKKAKIGDAETSNKIVEELKGSDFTVSKIDRKPRKRSPQPPFITSTLQQEASRKLNFTAAKTMMIAQQLYEGIEVGEEGSVGLITYMRTDSTRLSPSATQEARGYIEKEFGKEYLPPKVVVYKTKKKIQDAHEAIRPTSINRSPAGLHKKLSTDQLKLYTLIWKRFLACQMASAELLQTAVDIKSNGYEFRATGQEVKFPGFTTLYTEGRDDNGEENEENILPSLTEGQPLDLKKIDPKQHFTQPPPRFTEATLVKTLEEKGIGRPSTYATIIKTIQDRGYILKEKSRFRPEELGKITTRLLVESFPDILNEEFTAQMEDQLDKVETGEQNWNDLLAKFYEPFSKDLDDAPEKIRAIKNNLEETGEECPECSKPLVVKWGRNGKFMACSGYPECRFTKPLPEDASEPRPEPETTEEVCEKCGSPMVIRSGRYGKFMACSGFPKCRNTKPISLGIKCPLEGCDGDIAEKRSKRGRQFYGCTNYPKCNFVSWDKPINEKCKECGNSYLVEKVRKSGTEIKCPECDNAKSKESSASKK